MFKQPPLLLPEAERKSAARIIAATGGNTDRIIALHSVLNDYAAHGGPEGALFIFSLLSPVS